MLILLTSVRRDFKGGEQPLLLKHIMTPEQIVAKINERRTGTYAALGREAVVSKQQVQRILMKPPNTLKTLNKMCEAVGLELVVMEKEPDIVSISTKGRNASTGIT